MPVETVLGLIESREGIRVDVRKLSARLRTRIEQLNQMLLVFDDLNVGVETMKRKRREHLIILLTSLGFAMVGVFLGLGGLLQGYLGGLQATLSVSAALILFGADCYIGVFTRRLHSTTLRNSEQIEDFAVGLDASLDNVYHDILREIASARLQPISKRHM